MNIKCHKSLFLLTNRKNKWTFYFSKGSQILRCTVSCTHFARSIHRRWRFHSWMLTSKFDELLKYISTSILTIPVLQVSTFQLTDLEIIWLAKQQTDRNWKCALIRWDLDWAIRKTDKCRLSGMLEGFMMLRVSAQAWTLGKAQLKVKQHYRVETSLRNYKCPSALLLVLSRNEKKKQQNGSSFVITAASNKHHLTGNHQSSIFYLLWTCNN